MAGSFAYQNFTEMATPFFTVSELKHFQLPRTFRFNNYMNRDYEIFTVRLGLKVDIGVKVQGVGELVNPGLLF